MLVLSRRLREQVLIPGLDIKITILSVGLNRVQLGIEAPQHIHITRPEANRPTSAELDDESLRGSVGCSSEGRMTKLALYPSVEFQIA